MLLRPVLLCACVLTLAGCQTLGGATRPASPSSTASAAVPAPATAASAPTPASPWTLARERGMVFRAVGNAPDWTLEVSKSRTVTVAIAATERHLDVPDATIASDASQGTVTFSGNAADGTPVQVVIHRGQCEADMHARKSEAAVALSIGPDQLKGCGRFLIQ